MDRRNFLQNTGSLVLGTVAANSLLANTPLINPQAKKRLAMVGTGVRGIGMWGRPVIRDFVNDFEFVGLCDINPGRVETAKKMLNLNVPVFTDLDKMLRETKPDKLLVMTVDGTHHEQIIKGLEFGIDVITEKPMTIDEKKCQAILDAEKKSGKKVTVTFNYRYSPHRQKIFELLRNDAIGTLT